MAVYHILNGDCLAEQLGQTSINHNHIICRECLVEGNLNANNLADFWDIRANFIAQTYQVTKEEYFSKSVSEFEKINFLPENTEVNLWFENDLFCQTNMWFLLFLLSEQPTFKLFRVFPTVNNKDDIWKGFGISNKEMLENAYSHRVHFLQKDIELGKNLWIAYKSNDFEKLKELSFSPSKCFEYLEEVCQAHIDRFSTNNSLGRPERILMEIINTQSNNFEVVFKEYSKREGIYGFGDSQV